MSTKLSEIEALKTIDEHLEKLTEDERQRVFTYVASKYGLSSLRGSDMTGLAKSGASNGSINHQGGTSNDSSTIKQFLAQKKPQGFYEQIACLAYFLEKNKELDAYKTGDLTKANTEARATKIPNPSLYVRHTKQTYGYLSAVGGGKVALSARGEALVEALPDRDAVKEALSNHALKKKSARKKQTKI